MPRPRHPRKSWIPLLLVAAALAVWLLEQSPSRRETRRPAPISESAKPARPKESAGKTERSGSYEVHRGCTLAEYRNNDGDSFRVRLPDGRTAEFRLYFVDTPESAFKTYRGGDNNHARIRQQAADLGGITPEQAVETGKQAKSLTLSLLGAAPFTLHTCWDSPYQDQRYHAFVEVIENGRPRWLHELLVERGLARILTKPADLPDGTPASTHKQHLKSLESAARRAGRGAWGL